MNEDIKKIDFSFALENLSSTFSKESGVPPFLWNESLDTYIPHNDEEKRNLDSIKRYAEIQDNRMVLLMCGKCGTGKSHLGAGIVRERGGKMIDSDTLLLQIESGDNFKSAENKIEILDRFSNYKFLVVDEIGRSINPDKEKGYLSYIIRNRYNNRLPTVLISNLEKKDVLRFLGEPIVDRFRENCMAIEFDEESYRASRRCVNL